jgi:hypothetical protein
VNRLDHEKAPIAGLEEFLGEAFGIDDAELRDRAVSSSILAHGNIRRV